MDSLSADTSFYPKPQQQPNLDLLSLLLKSRQQQQAQPAAQQNQTASNTSGLPPEVTTGQSAPTPVPAQYAKIYQQAEDKYGLPAGYLAATAGIESSHNPRSYNELSGAKGQFQFIDSTGRQYGLVGRGFDKRYDMTASTDAAGRLARDNAQALQANGIEPTAGNLYLAHQQGAAGAIKLLTNPNVPAGRLVGSAAVSANGGNPDAPAGQFTQKWTGRFDNTARPRAMAYTAGSDDDPLMKEHFPDKANAGRPAGASKLDAKGNEIVDKTPSSKPAFKPGGDDDPLMKEHFPEEKVPKRTADAGPTAASTPQQRVAQGFQGTTPEGEDYKMPEGERAQHVANIYKHWDKHPEDAGTLLALMPGVGKTLGKVFPKAAELLKNPLVRQMIGNAGLGEAVRGGEDVVHLLNWLRGK